MNGRHVAPIDALVSIFELHPLINRETCRKKAKRIAFANVSGGEGNSFLSFNTAFCLAEMGFHVAVIDGDPQASLTRRLGLYDNPSNLALIAQHTILQVFEQKGDQIRLPEPLTAGHIHVWPAHRSLRQAECIISADLSRIGIIYEALHALEETYDFILLDSKSGASPLQSALIAAAEHIVVPVSGHKGMENLDELARLILTAKKFNLKVGIRLFVPNRVNSTLLSRHVVYRLSTYSRVAPLSPPIRESSVGGEAEAARLGVTHFAPNSPLAGDIRRLVDALLTALNPENPCT